MWLFSGQTSFLGDEDSPTIEDQASRSSAERVVGRGAIGAARVGIGAARVGIGAARVGREVEEEVCFQSAAACERRMIRSSDWAS